MDDFNTKKEDLTKLIEKGSFWGMITGATFLAVVITFAVIHFEEAKELLATIASARPIWILCAIAAQVFTYVFAGVVWNLIAKFSKHHLSFRSLLKLSVEQTSINHLIPTGGIAGNVIIVRAMQRLGLPTGFAMEVLFIDTLAYHISFSFVIFVSLIILFLYNHITPIILSLVGIFLIIEVMITVLIWTAVNHKKLSLPGWLKKGKIVSRLLGLIDHVSSERVFSAKLLAQASFFRLGIFLLDAITLYFIMLAIHLHASFSVVFVAFIIASVAGAITFLPGGVGGIEAAMIGMLVLLGTPLDGAIIGTFLLRGLTLWIPMIPGIILARKDLGLVESKPKKSKN